MLIRLFDTESTGLNGIMGELLCYSTLDIGEDTPISTFVDKESNELSVLLAAKDELQDANVIVGWNSKLHDIPFLNARLSKYGYRPIQPQMHIDLMYYAGGSSMKIGSKKLDNVAKYFKLDNQKTVLDWDIWKAASKGDQEAIEYIVDHCEQDVRVLEAVYWRLIPNVRNIHR